MKQGDMAPLGAIVDMAQVEEVHEDGSLTVTLSRVCDLKKDGEPYQTNRAVIVPVTVYKIQKYLY